jgi:hypothetical protein
MPKPTQAVKFVQATKATPLPAKRGKKPGIKNAKTIERERVAAENAIERERER